MVALSVIRGRPYKGPLATQASPEGDSPGHTPSSPVWEGEERVKRRVEGREGGEG